MAAKTIDSTNLRNNLSEAIDSVKPGSALLVKKRGRLRVAIVDLDEYEDLLVASDPEFVKSIAEARADKHHYTLQEVFADVWDETA